MLIVNEFLLRQAAKPSGRVNKEICFTCLLIVKEISLQGKSSQKNAIGQAYHSPLQRGGVSSPKGCEGEGLPI